MALSVVIRRLHARFGDGSFEEALSGRCVPTLAKIDVHHLPMLIWRPVQVCPAIVQAAVCLVHPPLPPDGLPMDTGGFLEERQEASDPAVDCATIHRHSTLVQPLDHICIAERVASVPAHGEGDQVIAEVAA